MNPSRYQVARQVQALNRKAAGHRLRSLKDIVSQLAVGAATAVVTTAYIGPMVRERVPGGPIGQAAIGAALVYGGTKVDGMAKGVVVGAGAALVTEAALSYFVRG